MSTIAATQEITTPAAAPISAMEVNSSVSVNGVPQNLAQIIAIAKTMAASGFYPEAKQAPQAAAIMLLGAAFGLTPAQSLTGIHVVKGKPMLHYSVQLAKVRQHPDYDYKIIKDSATEAEIHFFRHGEACGISRFTLQDAKRQGTQNMDKFPDTMLLARATSNGVKRYCPDVLNGMLCYVPGEIEDMSVTSETVGSKADVLRAELAARNAQDDPAAAAQPAAQHVGVRATSPAD